MTRERRLALSAIAQERNDAVGEQRARAERAEAEADRLRALLAPVQEAVRAYRAAKWKGINANDAAWNAVARAAIAATPEEPT